MVSWANLAIKRFVSNQSERKKSQKAFLINDADMKSTIDQVKPCGKLMIKTYLPSNQCDVLWGCSRHQSLSNLHFIHTTTRFVNNLSSVIQMKPIINVM